MHYILLLLTRCSSRLIVNIDRHFQKRNSMWYPSREQQQQYGWYGQMPQSCTQKHPTYSTSSYHGNDDELSTTSNVIINGENESSIHHQTSYDGNVHGKKRVIEKKFFFFSLFEWFCFLKKEKTSHGENCFNLFHF